MIKTKRFQVQKNLVYYKWIKLVASKFKIFKHGAAGFLYWEVFAAILWQYKYNATRKTRAILFGSQIQKTAMPLKN